MKKRGQLVYKAIISLIASAIIVISFISAGKTFGNREAFYKLAVAKDIALTIDLMYGLPGNVEYFYPNGISGLSIEIKDSIVKIYNSEYDASDSTAASYQFNGIASDMINAKIDNKKFLKIEKTGGRIKISGVDTI